LVLPHALCPQVRCYLVQREVATVVQMNRNKRSADHFRVASICVTVSRTVHTASFSRGRALADLNTSYKSTTSTDNTVLKLGRFLDGAGLLAPQSSRRTGERAVGLLSAK
jgi:hypothetical protein